MGAYIKKVHFKLHESYTNPNRIVTKAPYELTETGWGEFEIVIKIYFHDPNERPVSTNKNSDIYLITDKLNRTFKKKIKKKPYLGPCSVGYTQSTKNCNYFEVEHV